MISECTNEELLQGLANCVKTYFGALGHKKSLRNEQRADAYREEMVKRGMKVPNETELLKTGIFNGDGAA